MTTRPVSRRRALLALAAALPASLLSTFLLSAVPAAASSGPGGSTGCSGVTCYADVWQYIQLSGTPGAFSSGGGGPQLALPPPPCYMQPMFSGPQLYALWKAGNSLPSNPEAPFQAYAGAIKRHRAGTGGYWWERITNLQIGGTCGLPLLAWVVNGATPPLPVVPAVDLAVYAYDHMTLPSPRLRLNPQTRSYVSLPTYVWATLPFTAAHVTATLGNESATVYAAAGNLTLSAGGSSANVYDTGCTPRGSRATDPPANAGPGTIPDCGVTFTAPSTTGTIIGRIRWTATSGARAFPPILVRGNDQVPVDEIQSLNG